MSRLMRLEIVGIVVVMGLAVSASNVSAQAPTQPVTRLAAGQDIGRGIFTAIADAPIFVLPDASREPLRVAATGSVLRVIDVQGDWVNVEF